MHRVLIADDNQDLATLLQSCLVSEGYNVKVVFCGAAAIEYLQDVPDCNLVISDMIMPGTDGFDLIAFASEIPGLKIIAMTGGGVQLSAERTLETIAAQVHGTLEKPFQMDDLLALVSSVLEA